MADSQRYRVHKIGSVVYRLGLSKDVEVTSRLEGRSGNAIVVRALHEKRVYSELELENGRMSKIFRGDLLIGALGRRRALRGFAGDVPLYPGIGLSCWKDPHDAVKLAQQIGIIREQGLPGFTVFNFDGNAETVLPFLRLGVTLE